MPIAYQFIVVGIMLVLNAIFAAYEMALASIPRVKLAILANQKKRGADEALFMKDRMEASLAVVQLGITFVGAVAAATGGVGVVESFAPFLRERFSLSYILSEMIALILFIIPFSCFMITFAELIPKMYALNNREFICLTLSPAIKLLFQLGAPVIRIFEVIVKRVILLGAPKSHSQTKVDAKQVFSELDAAVSFARTSRLIGAREEKIVLSAAQLSVRPVKDCMLTAEHISMLPLEITLADALVRGHLDMHTRFPVCLKEGDPQTIIGYVNFKDIITALKSNPQEPNLKGILRPIKMVDENISISSALEQMMQEKAHIVLVSAGGQGVVGMVTMEDIMEELVGEIEDEFDRLPTYTHPYGNKWLMGGGVPLKTALTTIGITPPKNINETNMRLAEWCEQKLGRPVQGGDFLVDSGMTVMVRKLRRNKLHEAIVSSSSAPDTEK